MRTFLAATLFLIQLTVLSKTFSQSVKIDATGDRADSSSILDISSKSKGVLIPRMAAIQRLAIAKPAEGLLVYQGDEISGFYYYNTVLGWINLATATGSWSTVGNTGTNSGTNFIGTTDSISLSIRTNNVQRVFIDSSEGWVGINTKSPLSTLHINGSVSNAVTTTDGNITLTSAHHTVFLTGTSGVIVTLPTAEVSVGRIYVLVNQTAAKNTFPAYQTFTLGTNSTVIAGSSSITLESDGINWNRIQ